MCVDWSGTVNAINHDENAFARCGGTGAWVSPGTVAGLCAADGWIDLWWDGHSDQVCVAWEPDHVEVTPGPSTGDAFIMNGDGCPDGYTFVKDGGSYGGCTF